MSKSSKLIVVFLGIFALFFISFWLLAPLLQFTIVKKVFNYVVQNFVNVTGMSPFLVKGLVIILLIPFVWAILEITKLSVRFFKRKKPNKKFALSLIIFYVAAFFLSMFFLSRGTYFGHIKGEVMKFYASTPEGIRFFDSPGFDPKYGIELKPVTPQMIEQYERLERGMKPKRLDTSKEFEFFDSITGEAKVWYFIDQEGNYEFYDQPGFHPVFWEELKPVSPEIVLSYKNAIKKISEANVKKQEKDEEERRITEIKRKQQEDLALKRAFIEDHVNQVILNNPDSVEIVVIISNKDTEKLSESSIETANKICESLSNENTKAVSNLFKSQFFDEGYFTDFYEGDTKIIFDLELIKNIDYLILGIKESSFSTNERLEGLISCTLNLNLKMYSVETGEIISSNSFKVVGIGIDNKKAEQQAIDRVVENVVSYVYSKIKN